ncbi:MAG TPA: DUF3267 domain-containing protein [Bacillus bacterium]|uniref:Membrane protein n=1 Tax=Siminovitchia fordii TaxID=254759 RepID=A0ABQ4K2E2_9BACI|nr:DUF3267 domain-containing protein [Siminovitchia fordii]GIN19292.1 membrane protein [Siminovitchia fordii]HBZ10110.1 DUF3267 domain-containing protein [Bacillus sp. (in: firmicutes)]
MHCWKAYNVDRKHHFFRRFFISAMISVSVFIISYVTMQAIEAREFNDEFFLVFLCSFIILYPVHKFFHIVPIISYYKHMKWEIERYFRILPVIDLKVEHPIPKARFGLALILPFMALNVLLLILLFLYPQFGHYITILLAYHNGISAFDLLYFKTLFLSPKNALVEENDEGYEILVDNDPQ